MKAACYVQDFSAIFYDGYLINDDNGVFWISFISWLLWLHSYCALQLGTKVSLIMFINVTPNFQLVLMYKTLNILIVNIINPTHVLDFLMCILANLILFKTFCTFLIFRFFFSIPLFVIISHCQVFVLSLSLSKLQRIRLKFLRLISIYKRCGEISFLWCFILLRCVCMSTQNHTLKNKMSFNITIIINYILNTIFYFIVSGYILQIPNAV